MPATAYAHFPPADALRTGDLLFPRKASQPENQALDATVDQPTGFRSRHAATDMTMGELLARQLSAFEAPASPLVEQMDALMPKYAAHPTWAADHDTAPSPGKSELSLDDWGVMSLLLKIMKVEMSALFKAWLNMSVSEFIASDLGKFLFELLQNNSSRDENFFVGHMAMVIREERGQLVTDGSHNGTAYVIEANTTDYSHYRVAVHPYWVPEEPQAPHPDGAGHTDVGQLRGWANRRAAAGEKVWSASVAQLCSATDALQLVTAVVAQAKRWLGRPYGFFDHPTFGDPNRMYCAEYLYKVFKEGAAATGLTVKLDDRRTWGWMHAYFAASGQTRLHDLLGRLMTDKSIDAQQPFFVLTPAMVWCSGALTDAKSPENEGPYCVAVV